MNQDKM
jgi:hypothetical protein